jgi:hypothetical protein
VTFKSLHTSGSISNIAEFVFPINLKLNCKQKVNVHERGVFLCDTCSFLAASPDCVVSQDKTEHFLEIKCPYKWRNSTVEEAFLYIPVWKCCSGLDRHLLFQNMGTIVYVECLKFCVENFTERIIKLNFNSFHQIEITRIMIFLYLFND